MEPVVSPSGSVSSGAPPTDSAPPDRSGAILALQVFAWLDLIGGFLGAVFIWWTMGTRPISPDYTTLTEANPFGIAMGILVLLQGIFLCAFFLVVAGAAEDIAAIRSARSA